MSNNKFLQKRKIDIILICIIIVTIGIGLILDLEFLIGFNLTDYLPKVIIVDNKDIGDILSGVFSAQVSVSTLGIALISILGGVLKETVFGISISQYLMNEKPIIFKHKINITIELILIACSYVTFSLELYNLSVCIFFISIIIVLIMVWDIFPIFYGVEYMRADVKEYFISVFSEKNLQKRNKRETLISNIKIDTQSSIDTTNTFTLKSNLNLLIEILETIYNYKTIDDKEKILDFYEDNLADIFNKMLKDKDIENTITALEYINKIHEKCNELNKDSKNKLYLNILDRIARYLFQSIANLSKVDYVEFYRALVIESNLYENLDIKSINGYMVTMNNTCLVAYSSRTYYEILKKGFENYDEKNLFDIKIRMYKNLDSLINYNKFTDNKEEKVSQVYNQLYLYTKTLIDNDEKEILNKTFFKKLNEYYYERNTQNTEYIITMIIYMYYLIEVEELTSNELRKKIKDLIKLNQDNISNFLEYLCNIKWDDSNTYRIERTLRRWELMPEEDAKTLVMDSAVEKFIIFYSIQKSRNMDELLFELEKVVSNKAFFIYESIVINKKTLEQYTSFIKLLYNKEITEKEAKDKIDMLKETVTKLYKQSEIKKAKENKKTDEDYVIIKKKIKEIALNRCKKTLEIFINNKDSKKIVSKEINFILPSVPISFLDEYSINEFIEFEIDKQLVQKITDIIYKKLLKMNTIDNDKDMIVKLFDMNDKLKFNTDTIIGCNQFSYGMNSFNDFKEYGKDKFNITTNRVNDSIMLISSKKVYIKVIDAYVEIRDLDFEEHCRHILKNEKGSYIYKDILFSKEELEQYIYNSEKYISIKVNIECGLDDGYIGAGIFIDREA